MLMLLSMHVTSVLFLVWFNNFALTMGFYWSYTLLYSGRPFLCSLIRMNAVPQSREHRKPCIHTLLIRFCHSTVAELPLTTTLYLSSKYMSIHVHAISYSTTIAEHAIPEIDCDYTFWPTCMAHKTFFNWWPKQTSTLAKSPSYNYTSYLYE